MMGNRDFGGKSIWYKERRNIDDYSTEELANEISVRESRKRKDKEKDKLESVMHDINTNIESARVIETDECLSGKYKVTIEIR